MAAGGDGAAESAWKAYEKLHLHSGMATLEVSRARSI